MLWVLTEASCPTLRPRRQLAQRLEKESLWLVGRWFGSPGENAEKYFPLWRLLDLRRNKYGVTLLTCNCWRRCGFLQGINFMSVTSFRRFFDVSCILRDHCENKPTAHAVIYNPNPLMILALWLVSWTAQHKEEVSLCLYWTRWSVHSKPAL